jgi:hypothetical protein
MLYLTLTFWLLVIVFSAWGVLRLWDGLLKPKAINVILLPGTLVAQLGHVVGLLVTGAKITNTSLFANDSGAPETTQDAKPKLPIIGPIVIGMLPLLACATAIAVAARYLGRSFVRGFGNAALPTSLPTSLDGYWQLLRDQVTMVERLVNSIVGALPGDWQFWLFTYLMICLTIRMAPFPGNVRGSLGAIVLLGLMTAIIGLLIDSLANYIASWWLLLSLTVPTLLLLLLVSAMVRGAVSLSRIVRANG